MHWTLLVWATGWFAIAALGGLVFALGCGIGRRKGYEEGWADCCAYAESHCEIVLPELPELAEAASSQGGADGGTAAAQK